MRAIRGKLYIACMDSGIQVAGFYKPLLIQIGRERERERSYTNKELDDAKQSNQILLLCTETGPTVQVQ